MSSGFHCMENSKNFIKAKENYKRIKAKMKSLFKKPIEMSFDEVLDELKLSEDEYIYAIQNSLKSSKVFLKRGSCKTCICTRSCILKFIYATIKIQPRNSVHQHRAH